MKQYELIGKLILHHGFVCGFEKKCPYNFVVGIPCEDNKNFNKLYTIDREAFEQITDFTFIYDYILKLIDFEKSSLKDNMKLLNRIIK